MDSARGPNTVQTRGTRFLAGANRERPRTLLRFWPMPSLVVASASHAVALGCASRRGSGHLHKQGWRNTSGHPSTRMLPRFDASVVWWRQYDAALVRHPITDADLLNLCGTALVPSTSVDTEYVLRTIIGEGAHGIVFRADRRSGAGVGPAVVKVLRPRAIRDLANLAAAAIHKEVESLRLLSEQQASPHVVKFFDAGTITIGDNSLALPWLAVEYLDGGIQGVTLQERVHRSVTDTGFSFEPSRALRVIRSVCDGVSAIHSLGVIHRDVSPRNVLCTGSGINELLKIADFGLARVSSAATFGSVLLGTPGYCAPEQSFPGEVDVGPYSDVFSIACTAYYVLTGEMYFVASTIPETLVAVHATVRRSLLDTNRTHPVLHARGDRCAEVDRLLASATHPDPRNRPQSAEQLAERLVLIMSRP